MPVNPNTSDLEDLIQNGTEIRTTVFDFDSAQVKLMVKDELSIVTVSGVYSRALGKELERICNQCRSNLGLDFSEVRVNPALRKRFDSSIVGVLRNVRNAFSHRSKVLLLCTPPTELVDLLKLTGVYDGYQVVEQSPSSVFSGGLSSSTADTGAKTPRAEAGPGQPQGVLKKKIVNLNQSLKRTVSLEKGLDSAQRVVQRLLPQEPPKASGYSFAFSYKSSEKVGGDFFDFVPLSESSLGILVGDVSGHGLDAALMMGITKKVTILRARGADNGSPRDVLIQVNADLHGDFNKYAFVTALYGVLDLPTGRFTFARAGHETPVVFGGEMAPQVIACSGIPLCTDAGRNFNRLLEEKTVEIPRGGHLLLFTDGLPECWNQRGACFTRERLLFLLGQMKTDAACQPLLDRILQSISEFADGRAQEDDMTAILVKRTD